MKDQLNVRPADGVQVRKEDGSLMPDTGCEVPNNTYYRRRLRDQDLVEQETKPEAEPKAPAKKGAK